jgi:hypothetical protein
MGSGSPTALNAVCGQSAWLIAQNDSNVTDLPRRLRTMSDSDPRPARGSSLGCGRKIAAMTPMVTRQAATVPLVRSSSAAVLG